MSKEDTSVWHAALNPASASYGTRGERVVAALVVGVLAGVVAGTAMYNVRQSAVAPAWTSDLLSGTLVLVSGALVKLLCEQPGRACSRWRRRSCSGSRSPGPRRWRRTSCWTSRRSAGSPSCRNYAT
ncbi:hypothetical protein ACFQRB_09935 [Halobaculum litoreum]|uniref:Uncharacterized protein n=1 Tax=Halobaculum litoreum TaxID=3031998 RepID=A0ABD5XSU8_9EURY